MTATSRRSRRCRTIPPTRCKLGKNQGRGVASGYWFNGGGEFERDDAGQRRRHRAGGDRQPGHRRLARLDGDHGGRDAGRRLQRGAGDRRRHRLGRLHPCDRRLARHLRHRHGGGERHQDRDQGPVQARRDDLGRRPRGRDLGRRLRQAGGLQRRRLRAAVAEGARRRRRRRPAGRSPRRRR